MSNPLHISARVAGLRSSMTIAVSARAAAARAAGADLISFAAGQPDFATPEHILEAARVALTQADTGRYTNVAGIWPLREAVAHMLNRVHGLTASADQVLVSSGAKHSLYNALCTLLEPGDEVLILAPYWVSYPAMVELCGGAPVVVATDAQDNFEPTPAVLARLADAITPRTRAIILNNPCNPTGAAHRPEQVRAIAQLALTHDLAIISDDIYRELMYDDASYQSIAALDPEIAARTIIIDGVSKSHAMTGWRIGFALAPRPIIAAMAKLQGQSTSNASHIAQRAALAAVTGPQTCVADMRAAYARRRQAALDGLRAIADVSCGAPRGAFYAFPDLSAFIGRQTPTGQQIASDIELCDYLMSAAQVALIPGSGFGAPGFARLSYACGIESIHTGLARLQRTLPDLR